MLDMKESLELSNRIALAYIAGFFDGEGCVYIERDNRSVRTNPFYVLAIQADNNDRRPLEFIRGVFGFGAINVAHPGRSHIGYRWRCRSKNAVRFLRSVHPYLHNKKEEAELGLDFQLFKDRHIKAGRRQSVETLARCEDYYKQMRVLKK